MRILPMPSIPFVCQYCTAPWISSGWRTSGGLAQFQNIERYCWKNIYPLFLAQTVCSLELSRIYPAQVFNVISETKFSQLLWGWYAEIFHVPCLGKVQFELFWIVNHGNIFKLCKVLSNFSQVVWYLKGLCVCLKIALIAYGYSTICTCCPESVLTIEPNQRAKCPKLKIRNPRPYSLPLFAAMQKITTKRTTTSWRTAMSKGMSCQKRTAAVRVIEQVGSNCLPSTLPHVRTTLHLSSSSIRKLHSYLAVHAVASSSSKLAP